MAISSPANLSSGNPELSKGSENTLFFIRANFIRKTRFSFAHLNFNA